MQKSLDTWQGCLTTTGGALDWDDRKKCYCYKLAYSQNQQGQTVYSNDDDNTQLSMLDDNNQQKMVYQCKPSEARKTLGVYIAPDGNMDAQIEYMYNKACAFSSKLRHCQLTGYDALYAVNTRIMKTLQYPLPTLHLTKSECTKIMYPILCSLLGKMKIVRTIKREILYGPRQHQGF